MTINIEGSPTSFYKQINKIKQQSDKLRNSYDFQVNFIEHSVKMYLINFLIKITKVNYWIMSFIASIFPENILRKILSSAQCTMAISNLPGPQKLCKINNLLIKKINFWLPNRSTTGIGISILSYNNKLQLGILADKAILAKSSDCEFILRNIVEEIFLIE